MSGPLSNLDGTSIGECEINRLDLFLLLLGFSSPVFEVVDRRFVQWLIAGKAIRITDESQWLTDMRLNG